MGAFCDKPSKDQFRFETQAEAIKTIKYLSSLPNEEILYFLKEWIEFETLSAYLGKLKLILNAENNQFYAHSLLRPTNQRQQIYSNTDLMMYHLEGISNQIKEIDRIYRETEKQSLQVALKLKEKDEWTKQLSKRIKTIDLQMKPRVQIEMSDSSSNISSIKNSASNGKLIKQKKQRDDQDEMADDLKRFSEYSAKIEKIITEEKSLQCEDDERTRIIQSQFENMKGLLQENKSRVIALRQERDQYLELSEKYRKSLIIKKNQFQEEIKMIRQKLAQKNEKIQQQEIKINSLKTMLENLQKKQQEKQKDLLHKIEQSGMTTPESRSFNLEKYSNEGSKTQSFLQKIFGLSAVLFSQSPRQMHKNRDTIIELFSPREIQRTQLLFEYDPISKNNIESYITGKSNLLFLGLLENGVIAGGFSPCNFKAKPSQLEKNQNCFIFSIQPSAEKDAAQSFNKMVLKQKNLTKYSVKLDRAFLRFGSNQLRVRCGTDQGSTVVENETSNIFVSLQKGKENTTLQSFLNTASPNFTFTKYQVHEIVFKS